MVSLRLDRAIAMSAIIAITTLSWLYLAYMTLSHGGHGLAGMATPRMTAEPLEQFAAGFLMWAIMMVAMMLPTAAPAIGMFGSFAAKRPSATGSAAPALLFILGYVAVWTAYSAFAAAGQVALSHASLLAPTLQSTSVVLSASLLVVAGGFQFTPLKDACLTQCRSPLPFLLAHWRDGRRGAFVLGMQHGSYCVGCCWALMGLMFVFGSMNLLWMAALSLFMLGEKIAPGLFRAAGVVRTVT